MSNVADHCLRVCRQQSPKSQNLLSADHPNLGFRHPQASPGEIASALVELLAQPQYSDAAADAATAIAADEPDETATEALLSLAHLAN